MHKIFELKEMGLEEVQSIATELKIKNVKKKDKEELIYEILESPTQWLLLEMMLLMDVHY